MANEFTSIGNDAQSGEILQESYVLVEHFPTIDATINAGSLVTLATTGLVTRITAATQRPLGYVASSWGGLDKGNVRVCVPFVAVLMRQNAAAAINPGVMLTATGVAADGVTTTYATAVSTNYVSAMALSASTGANTVIKVGILRVPYLMP